MEVEVETTGKLLPLEVERFGCFLRDLVLAAVVLALASKKPSRKQGPLVLVRASLAEERSFLKSEKSSREEERLVLSSPA